MTADAGASPGPTPPCRDSFDAPCRLEQTLRQALHEENLRLATALHEDLGNHLFGTVMCLAALRGRVRALDPALAAEVDQVAQLVGEAADRSRAAACSASSFVATHHGLTDALQMRFGPLAAGAGQRCHLVLQASACDGLSREEHCALLAVAEEAVGQASREGSTDVRVMLRRSRLGTVELSIAGEGAVTDVREVADSYRSLARIRQLALAVDARVSVRRLSEGGLFVRCTSRWRDEGTGRWASGR